MIKTSVALVSFLSSLFISCSSKIIPDKPSLPKTEFKLDSLPESEVNIPIQLNLQPIYSFAEKTVDTVFTSPNWPDGWVQSACDTRYKYTFRRGPLQMKASGTSLLLGFMGYYKIIGSSRVCVNGAAISPWTPACRCGYDEGERKVNVSFQNSITIQPDLKASLAIKRLEPQPIDKCNVCFWGQDVTKQVMQGLKEELDSSKAEMERNFRNYDLRPKFQMVWDQLNKVYGIYGLGWLQINPTQIRINNFFAKNDTLSISVGISAKPSIGFEKPKEHFTIVPNLSNFSNKNGFNIFLDAVLNYDSLSNILTNQLRDKRIDVAGNKYIIVKECSVYGMDNENLIVKVKFEGSQSGVFYLTGKPGYDATTKIIEMKDLDFDIKSKSVLLKTAAWLFNSRVETELKKVTKFDLSTYIESAKSTANQQLNKEWVKGISSAGKINDLRIAGIFPLRQYLVVRSNCNGDLSVKIDAANFSF